MKLVVVGAGALGTYFGLRMWEAGHDVTFLVRERRAEQIKKNGLKIESVHGNVAWENPKVVTTPDEVQEADLVLLAVKGYHLDGALASVRALADKGAAVYPVLNGVEHIPRLQTAVGHDAVFGGVAYIVAALNDKGHVVHTGGQHTFIYGTFSGGDHPVIPMLKEASRQVKMELVHSDDIQRAMWQKYVFITVFSSLTTTSRLPIGAIREVEPLLALGVKVLEEMVSLAEASGIPLPDMSAAGLDTLRAFPDEATSSMHQDLIHGRPLEVDHLLGGALRIAAQKGIDVPHVETLYALLKPYEKGPHPLSRDFRA